ncbi:MAG: glycosyltransferase family 39 protein [bacterium]|nr:glycosyltransferase family 39 protein [bacterium]MDZ4300002.1 glycosyltransferase family 39 protein [Candidatus Sungbacteria bacterium]
MGKKSTVALLLILALGIFLRFFQFTALPPGLYPDEAMNGSNALEAIHTDTYKLFYPENNGREGLFINIQALSIWLFGNTSWALRFVSAIFGILTILGVYLVAKELFMPSPRHPEHIRFAQYKLREGSRENSEGFGIPRGACPEGIRRARNDEIFGISSGKVIALLSAFFIATSYWHLHFSRMGFRAISLPFFAVFGIYFLLRGIRRSTVSDIVLGGIFTGLGFHTYIAFRFMPLVLAPPLLLYLSRWWHSRGITVSTKLKSACAPCVVTLFIFAVFITALPIGWYFLHNPADFIGRGGQLSIFSADAPAREFAIANLKTVGMFFVRGDCNPRHNYNCLPELNPIVALFFLIGIIRALRQLFGRNAGPHLRMASLTLLSWLAFMSLGVTLTREGLPHALRAIGMIPPALILAGWGGAVCLQKLLAGAKKLSDKDKRRRGMRRRIIGFAVLLATIPLFTFYSYFVLWGTSAAARDAFAADITHLGMYLAALPPETEKYIIVQEGDFFVRVQTVMYLTDTYEDVKRAARHTHYVPLSQLDMIASAPSILIAPLNQSDIEEVRTFIAKKFPALRMAIPGDFTIFK